MNISEIARLAEVSPATVSRYLNKGYLSAEKKARIEKVIAETGYVPSRNATTLRTGKTKLVGVIIPKIDSDSISRVVAGVSDVLTEAGYQLILANTENNAEKELEYLGIFRQTNVDGIILLGTVMTAKHRKAFQENTIPTVVLGQETEKAACIFHDDYQAAYSLTEYALGKGYRKIAYIGVTEKDIAVGLHRKKGFMDAMNAHGVPDESLYCTGSFRMDNGYDNAARLLEQHAGIEAFLCATDTIALGVIKYLHEKGIAIPEQIGVAGMGESRFSSVVTPSLTTVHYFYKECGIAGAELLLAKMRNADLPNRKIKLDCNVVENGSL